MPTPKKGEKKDDYMKRCVPMLIDEGKDNDQAVAVCSAMYDEKSKNSEEPMKNEPTTYEFIIHDENKLSNGMKIMCTGMDMTRFSKHPVMLYNHGDLVLGKWKNIRMENNLIKADAEWDEEDPESMNIKNKVDKKLIEGASIGAKIKEYSWDEVEGCMNVLECDLIEASITPIPANESAFKLYLDYDMKNEVNFEYLKNSLQLKNKNDIMKNKIAATAETTIEASESTGAIAETTIEASENTEAIAETTIQKIEDNKIENEFFTILAKNLNIEMSDNSTKNQNLVLLEVKKYKDFYDKFESEKADRENQEIKNYIDMVIKNGVCKVDQKENLLKMSESGFDTLKKFIDSLPKPVKLAQEIKNFQEKEDKIAKERIDWTMVMWMEKDPEGLKMHQDMQDETWIKLTKTRLPEGPRIK